MILRPRPLLEFTRGAGLLVVLGAVVAAVQALSPTVFGESSTLRALGLLLFGGYLAAHVGERFGLPHVTGYLVAGFLLGPQALGVIRVENVEQLRPTNSVALALIALTAGAELRFGLLRRGARSLAASVVAQICIVLPVTFLTFLALRSFLPFPAALSLPAAGAAALLWGTIALSRSPSSTLGVISELRPEGPLARQVLSVVITMDLIVLVAYAGTRLAAGALLDPSPGSYDQAVRELGTALVGSIACGTTLGLLLAGWLHFIRKQLILFLLLVAYSGTQLARYFSFEPLLLFLTAGFVAANVTGLGDDLLDLVGAGGQVVFVVFFALAGAHVDLALVARLWPLTVALWLARAGATVAASHLAARMAGDPPAVRRYAGLSLLSQAGTTISLAVGTGERFPALGAGFTSLAIAVVALNELAGPILFKWSLARAGELRPSREQPDPAPAPLAHAAATTEQ